MKRLNPSKLKVSFKEGVTPISPIIPRKYTLTHSDNTGELFLDIGSKYNIDAIGPMRDEVLAEWYCEVSKYGLSGYCYVGGDDYTKAAFRYAIFKKELPLALEAMRFGDIRFFEENQQLMTAPIWIYFDSPYKQFNRFEYWGTMKEYS